jgi:hypothetical protein
MHSHCVNVCAQLEDNMMNLTMMANSAFAGHFKDDLRRWERDLSTVLESLDVWQVMAMASFSRAGSGLTM